ncbi:hypothetical protein QCA50_005500 [Cerrena zonata]|uniref:Uncharacterized protein n=1 Tax=Cerrena zonata TaxID=2478898 RepID=A0AAW0GRA3_9APHY
MTSRPSVQVPRPICMRHGVRQMFSKALVDTYILDNPSDTGILTAHVKASHGGTAQTFAADMVKEIKTGSFKSLTSSWLSCSSTTQPVASKRSIDDDVTDFLSARATDAITPLACPLVWASESNAFDCSTVFSFTTGEDLCTGTYFNNAVPVIDLQIAKQGFRLAAWLNVLFDGATEL